MRRKAEEMNERSTQSLWVWSRKVRKRRGVVKRRSCWRRRG